MNNGYNQSVGGMGCRGYKHTDEEIKKMRQIQSPKSVLQLDMDGNLIRRWDSASHAAKQLGLYSLAIKNCCNRLLRVKSVGGYIWIFEEDKDTVDMTYYLQRNISYPKQVNQYDMDMNLIKTWESAYAAQKSGEFSAGEISKVCSGNRKSHKGFIFKHKNECDNSVV